MNLNGEGTPPVRTIVSNYNDTYRSYLGAGNLSFSNYNGFLKALYSFNIITREI